MPIILIGCSADDDQPQPVSNAELTALVGNENFTALGVNTNFFLFGSANPRDDTSKINLFISAFDSSNNYVIELLIFDFDGIGTYTIEEDNIPFVANFMRPSERVFSTNAEGGSGTIAITSVDNDLISGTFEFVAIQENDDGTRPTITITNGNFSELQEQIPPID